MLLGQPGVFPTGVDTAARFDGSNDSVTVPATAALNLRRQVTLSMWIKPDAFPRTWQALAYKAGSTTQTSRSYTMWLNSNGSILMSSYDTTERAVQTAAGSVTAGEWTHVVAVMNRDAGVMSIYLNGLLAAQSATIGTANAADAPSQPLYIGNTPEFAAQYAGLIDEAAVFPVALTPEQIAAQFAADRGTVSVDLVTTTNTVVANIATDILNLGTTPWTVPNVPEGQYRIRITYNDGTNSFVSYSNSPFTITNGSPSYYVNDGLLTGDVYASAVGNDANTGKSPDKPMRSLAALLAAYDLDAGDTVYVDSGTYALPINVRIASGDSGVAIVGAGRSLTTLTRNLPGTSLSNFMVFEVGGATNVGLANMTMTGSYYGVYSSGSATGLVIEDSKIFGNNSAGIQLGGDNSAVIRRNILYGIPGGSTLDNQTYGIFVAGSGNTIEDNELYDHTSPGVYFADGVGNLVQRNRSYRNSMGIYFNNGAGTQSIIRDNETFNNTTYGIQGTGNVLIDHNVAYGQTGSGDAGIFAYATGSGGVTNNVVYGNYDGISLNLGSGVRGNRAYGNSNVGIASSSTSTAQIIGNTTYSNSIGIYVNASNGAEVSNNLVYANTNWGILVTSSNAGGTLVSGNTIYQDVGDALHVYTSGTNTRAYGNILRVNSGVALFVDASSQTGFAADNNLFNPTTGAASVGIWGTTAYATLAAWRTASGKDANSVAGDPLFVDIDGTDNLLGYVAGVDRGQDDNFHLRATSPAIDHGTGQYQLATDLDGDARADDPVTSNAGGNSLFASQLGTSSFNASAGVSQNFRADDSATSPLLGFSFPFFGSTYTQVTLTTNGTIFMGTSNWTASGANSAAALGSYAVIAPLWDDLRTDGKAADNIFKDSSVANQVTFRWRATNKADGSDVNFSVTLYSTGQIDFDYGAGNTNLTPTIGINGGVNRGQTILAPISGQGTLTNAGTIRYSLAPSIHEIGAFEFLGRSDDTARPIVVGTTPAGVHSQGTTALVSSIAVQLSEAVDARDAQSTSIYELRGAGADAQFGTLDDVIHAVVPTYTSLSTTINLGIAQGALPSGQYRLTIKGSPAGNSGLHDLAGNVLDGTGAGGGDYTRVFTVAADTTPPTVSGATFVYDAISAPHEMRVTFSEDVGASLLLSDFVLSDLTHSTTVLNTSLAFSYDTLTRVATITFPGFAGGFLPDARYRLTLAAGAVTDAAGNPLAATYTFDYRFLRGDANNDGTVNFTDLLTLAAMYGSSGRTFGQGNFDYSADGLVGFGDLLLLAANYGMALGGTVGASVAFNNADAPAHATIANDVLG
ncbi:MAG: right-handed parallel beta-helix repeat-containing protein [Tepidisphaeraceae bacterium]